MIIRCPQCSSEFVLHLNKLPRAKPLPDHGYGWVMACSACKHRWWHKSDQQPLSTPPPHTEMSITPVSDDFEDLTDLEGLKRIIANPPLPAKGLLAESTFYQPTGREASLPSSNREEPALDLEGRRLKSEPRSVKQRLPKVLFFFWLFFLFLMGVLTGVFFMYKDQIYKVWDGSSEAATKQLANIAPLVLQNIKYASQRDENSHNYLNVMGEIVNNNSTAIALQPLRVVVWSQCPATTLSSTPVSPSAQSQVNCIKADWSHTWERSHILPGERLWFQTGAPLPLDVKIERVEVTLPQNFKSASWIK